MSTTQDASLQLLAAALAYPDAWEDHPWGDTVAKVRKKIFLFVSLGEGDRLQCTVKLPLSAVSALEDSHATPTGYGLGKSGWVSFGYEAHEDVPLEQLLAYLDESYRAVALKSLIKKLDAGA